MICIQSLKKKLDKKKSEVRLNIYVKKNVKLLKKNCKPGYPVSDPD